MNKNICIAIPTYNRPDILYENLLQMLPELSKRGIYIVISDDSTNDLTQKKINLLKESYSNIIYEKNPNNIGHDLNCEKVLKLANKKVNSTYIWYLGDGFYIDAQSIDKTLSQIVNKKYDIITVNSQDRVKNLITKVYHNPNDFFTDLGWHITLTGVTIYSSDLIENANFEKYYKTDFIQTGISLDYLASKNNSIILWDSDIKITPNLNKVISYWSNRSFEVFIKKWSDFIISLPEYYSLEAKYKCIKKHDLETKLFKFKNLILLREKNSINIFIFIKYYKYYKNSLNIPTFILFLISITPKSLIRFYRISRKVLKGN